MQADYVIIGSGSAGSTMAYRLGEAGKRVIVIEQGGSDAGPFIQMPAALSYPMNMPLYDWGLSTEPEPHLGGRRLVTPRGKVIGGSSSINGMVYVRGHARDYETWESMGAQGWSYADVLPYFQRMENWHGGEDAGAAGDQGYRGTDGPLHITRGPRNNPLFNAFIQAGQQAGYQMTGDYNGQRQEGFGAMEATIWKGKRWSAASAYLRPAMAKGNVELVRGFARKVVIENGRAVGVEIARGGAIEVIRATAEVIVAASAINSPKLMMLSGIGDAAHLKDHGIDVVAHRPGVGANLQDHLQIRSVYKVNNAKTLNTLAGSLVGKAMIGLEYAFKRTGPMSMAPSQLGAFTKSDPSQAHANIQYHVQPLSLDAFGEPLHSFPAITASVCNLNPTSRGTVQIKTNQFDDAPAIAPNYLATEEDRKVAADSLRVTRRIMAQPAMAPFAPEEFKPGVQYQTDEELAKLAGDIASTIFHPVGTTRMGREDDPMAVVNPRLQVRGVAGLRVVDAGVMPTITSGNTNSPTLMIAEKAAQWIAEDASRHPVA